jgi:hypothetical protein
VPPGHVRRAPAGQVQADGAPVAGAVSLTRHVPGCLQAAEQGRDRAGREPQQPGKLAGPDPRVLADAGQQLELGDGKPERGIRGARRAPHGAAQPGHDVGQFRAARGPGRARLVVCSVS